MEDVITCIDEEAEAALILDGNWEGEFPAFTQSTFDDFMNVQALRVKALEASNES